MFRAKDWMGCLCLLVVLAVSAVSTSQAAPIILKEFSGAGYTFANTPDTQVDSYGASSKQYNYGGKGNYSNMYADWRAYLVSFDLGAIPDKALVTAVNSATLRVYRITNDYSNVKWNAGQIAQSWTEGTGQDWSTPCDGAQWYTRNAGTTVPASSLGSYGGGIYYADGVSSLADDPVNAGKKHIRPAGINWDNEQDSFTQYNTLADLQAAGGTRGYFYDSAASRLYLNKNDKNVRWYSTADQWTTAGGSVTGGYVTSPMPAAGSGVWLEFDVKDMVTNWLLGNQGNYGFRLYEAGAGGGNIAASEYADGALRPELVLDLTIAPEPTTLCLLALAGLVMARRRQG
jgi:hypothetical protein